MSTLRVQLFGRFNVRLEGHVRLEFDIRKAIELFCYLMVYRERPHPRETLADLIWGGAPSNNSKKYLRQALWKIHSVLGSNGEKGSKPLLLVDPEWIQINPNADLWLDVAEFERAGALIQDRPGRAFDAQSFEKLKSAIELYQGDLMEGWYVDWCLFERERLQNMLLTMLGKLMGYCEAHNEYEQGLAFGERILRYDVAREQTHRRMARLYYLAGNRTAALRQYELCVSSLKEQLGVSPAQRTLDLYEQICEDQLPPSTILPETEETRITIPRILDQLDNLRGRVSIFQEQMLDEIQAVQNALRQAQRPSSLPDQPKRSHLER